MKLIASRLLIAILLLAGAEVLRRAGDLEDTLAAAQQRLATQSPAAASSDEAATAAPWIGWLPVFGPSIEADLRRARALESYWRGDYAALETAGQEAPPADAALRLISANATFRDLARRPLDNQALVRGLDAALKAYFSVLEADPAVVDAAFNFEFVSRLRAARAAGRGNGLAAPSRSNPHGEQGSPPNQVKPNDFNIIVPLRPDERQDQADPQGGSTLQRKG